MQEDAIRWDLYPHVAACAYARAFVVRLRQLSRQPKTVDAYARNLDAYLAYFATASDKCWIEADEGVVLTYLDQLRSRRRRGVRLTVHGAPQNVVTMAGNPLSTATLAQHVVAIRQFYDFLIQRRIRRDLLHPLPRGTQGHGAPQRGPIRHYRHLPWIAPTAAWDCLLLHVITKETVRNRAMILVAYDGALRREELVRLRAEDYDEQRSLVKIRAETSKSGRDRWVPLSPFSERVLQYYLRTHRQALVAAYGLDEQGPLFLSESTRNPGRALLPGAFNDVVAALRAALDLPHLHPHTFRHQRLTDLKSANVPLDDIALFAGHASTESTRLYVHTAPVALGKRLREATAVQDARMERLVQEALDARRT